MGQDNDSSEAQFQRTPGRDIFGPLDDSLPEIRINADVKTDALRAAHALGLDLTAYLRENLYGSLYGPAHVARLHEERMKRVLGNARRESVPELRVVDPMRKEA